MNTGAVRAVVLGAAVLLSWPLLAAAGEYGELLERADGMRSRDPQAFGVLLDELADRSDGTPSEQRHLRLLQNYRRAILGEYEEAVGDAVVLVDQAPEPALQFRAALFVANVSALNRDYIFGLRYLDRALELQPTIESRTERHRASIVAGTLYNQFGHFGLALEHADRVLDDAPSPRDRCSARQIRVRALDGLDRPIDEAVDVHEAIADCAAQREAIMVGTIRLTLASQWAAKGKTRQAIALLRASLPEAEATRYAYLISEVRSLLAQYSLDAGDEATAGTEARAVVAMPGTDPLSRANVTAERVLYELALRRGDTAAALEHYRRYAENERARLDDIKAREYAFQVTRAEVAQKNQAIALLSNQNQLLRLQQEVAERKAWNSRLAIALLLVLAASAGYWGWRARRVHRSLRELAETDGLTGLSNRRHFRNQTETALAECEPRGRPVCVLLLDLDHFKQINDQCGHSSGDWVLREVAKVGRLHCRSGDLWGRIGGEEFAMTLVDCELPMAHRIAEDLRQSIACIDASVGACSLPVTASIGVVGTSGSGYDYEAMIAHADAAMYRAKVSGRNCVKVHEAPGHGDETASRHAAKAASLLKRY